MRCTWCGNRNVSSATVCAHCQHDLMVEQTTQDAVALLEGLEPPEPEVLCPACGASNFLGTEFCDLCHASLHPGVAWPAPPTRPVRSRTAAADVLIWAAMAVPVLAVVAISVVVLLGLNSGTSALLFRGSADSAQLPQAPGDTIGQVRPPDADSTAFEATERYERRVPKEKVSAEDRAAAAAARANATVRPRSLSPASPASPGRLTLPLPTGGRLQSQSHFVGNGLGRGQRIYTVRKSVADVYDLYDSASLAPVCRAQGLFWSEGSVSYQKGKTAADATGGFVLIKVEGRSDCSIRILVNRPSPERADLAQITVEYVLPASWTLNLK